MKVEVRDYWDRAVQALETARTLVDRDPDASASRAYYAAFYAVSALLSYEEVSLKKHSAVERAVHRDLVRAGRWPAEVGAAFSWLASLRYTGDYGGAAHVTPEEAQSAAARAALVLRTVRVSVPEPLPSSAEI